MLVWDDNSENLYPSKTIVNDVKHYLYNITMQEFQEKVDSKLFKLRPHTNTGAPKCSNLTKNMWKIFKNCTITIQGTVVQVINVAHWPLVLDAIPISSSDNLTVTVGGIVGACVIVMIGAVFVLLVIRYAFN